MLFSVIIPVFNRKDFLPRLFSSLVAISHRPLEIVLVDNASDDGSLQACYDFKEREQAKELHIKVAIQPLRGVCRCRNKGLTLSTGEYVYFFDSDDEISADFFADIKKEILSESAPDMVCAPTMMVFPNGSRKKRDFIATDEPFVQILTGMLSTQTMVIRREWLLRTQEVWDETLPRWNDWEFGVRLLLKRPHVKWLAGKHYHKIHQHPHSISGRTFSDDLENLSLALGKVEALIGHDTPNRHKETMALSAKTCLLAALLYREGSKREAHLCHLKALQLYNSSLFTLIYILSCLGLPGCWRIYLSLIRWKYFFQKAKQPH